MGLANIEVIEKGKDYLYANIIDFDAKTARKLKLKIIQWVPLNSVRVSIIKAENGKLTIVNGLAEPDVQKLKINEIIQFYRFGFVKIEKITDKVINMIYLHD